MQNNITKKKKRRENESLVLGGAGYIGSHAVDQLIEEGFDVVVVDNLETGHKAIHHKAKFYEEDCRNIAFMENVFKNRKFMQSCTSAYSLVSESMKSHLNILIIICMVCRFYSKQ